MPERLYVATRYRLKLTSLKFISPVDSPAQETALAVLTKRKNAAPSLKATARVVKTSDELGLVFCWALTTKAGGSDYFDLHGDNVIEDDLIKVAAEFMEGGGLTDEMHDRDPDGKVVFCMPLTAEVAKAFGVTTDTEGLMIALRPSAEVFAKYKSGEYVGVSIDGAGIREEIATKSARVIKHALYTTEVLGHQHTVDVSCMDAGSSWYTSYQNAEGSDSGHSHAVMRNADGTIVILADGGHTHELAADQATVIVVPSGTTVLVENAAGARVPLTPQLTKSTPSAAIRSVGLTSKEQSAMTTEAQKIADLEKQLADLTKRADRIAKMSGAHKTHFDTLTGDDAEAFLAKSNAERELVVGEVAKRADEANKVVYVSKSDGAVYRAKDDVRMIEMAKRLDGQADEIEKADVRKAALEQLGGMPGDDATHDYIVKSIRKGGGDAAMIEKATAALKGMKATSTLGKGAAGAGGVADPQAANADDALEALEKGLVAFAKAQSITKNVWTDGLSAFVKTTEGEALKRAYDESRAG